MNEPRCKILCGDSLALLREMEPQSVHCCVTSPPYWGLRDYGVEGQLGLEKTPEEYVGRIVEMFEEVRRVLRDDGTLWLNLGDSYVSSETGGDPNLSSGLEGGKSTQREAGKRPSKTGFGLPVKNLVGIPWRVAFALQAARWYLRQDIIWHKPNPMPESVTDRCTKAHEYVFLFSKSERYHYDAPAIAEPLSTDPDSWGRHSKKDPGAQALRPRPMFRPGNDGTDWGNGKTRNRRSVWTIPTQPYPDAHFATFPEALVEPCILTGCPEDGIVLDPFGGSGTTGAVALRNNRRAILLELNPEYVKLAERRVSESANNQMQIQEASCARR